MFKEILETIVSDTGGAFGASLMGFDGIPIEQYFLNNQDLDIQLVSVEYTNIIKDICKTAEILKLGEMKEVSIRTDKLIMVLRIINTEYFVVLFLEGQGNFGKGRYTLMRESANLIEAMS